MSGITGSQVKAARKLLRWSQNQLAMRAHIGHDAVTQLESGVGRTMQRTKRAIRVALEAACIEFTQGGRPGVRLKNASSADASEHELGAAAADGGQIR
jgi:transcriptional regulator with XRE-family HTH domain